MVDCQLRTFDVTDRAVLAAMEELPRESFMPDGMAGLAYLDRNVPLPGKDGAGIMLQPMVVGRLVQALSIEAGAAVLDVGSGLGYAAALLARLGARVVALEADPDLASSARDRLARAGLGGMVEVRTGPLAEGVADRAPFDAILVNGAVEERPATLLGQLAEGGRLACLEAGVAAGRAVLHVRVSGGGYGSRPLFNAVAPILPGFRRAPAFTF